MNFNILDSRSFLQFSFVFIIIMSYFHASEKNALSIKYIVSIMHPKQYIYSKNDFRKTVYEAGTEIFPDVIQCLSNSMHYFLTVVIACITLTLRCEFGVPIIFVHRNFFFILYQNFDNYNQCALVCVM